MTTETQVDRSFIARFGGRWAVRTAVLLVLVSACGALGQAVPRSFRDDGGRPEANTKLSPELRALMSHARAGDQRLSVIVQFKDSSSTAKLQQFSKQNRVQGRELGLVRGGVFDLSLSQLKTLATDGGVAYISPNRSLRGADDEMEETVGGQLAQSYGWDGTGIGVAVIDSGISDHPDLHDPVTGLSRVVYNESFVTGADVLDHYGHGTHVAGIIGGNGQQSGGNGKSDTNGRGNSIYGIAPNVRLINLKVLDSNGNGKDASVIAALQRAIALKNTYNIRVVNLSLGRRVFESYKVDPLCQAVEAAWKAGLVVVVAAGNWGRDNSLHTKGYGMIAAPGNDPYVLTVGATKTRNTETKSDDRIATYSSKGPSLLDHVIKPDLVAPGNRIQSLLVSNSTLDNEYKSDEVAPQTYGGSGTKYYFTLSGTSMATPVVSGGAVLVLQQASKLTPDQVKARLMKTTDKTVFPTVDTSDDSGGQQYNVFTVGSGYLNIATALADTNVASGSAVSPTAVRSSSGNVLLVPDPSSVWASSVIWGSSVVWGNTVLLTGSSVIWGSSVVWGNCSVDGYSVIWGSSVVWGASLDANNAESVDGNGDDDGDSQ